MGPEDARAEPPGAAGAALDASALVPGSARRVERDVDAALMARVRAGDREAFADLVDRHKDALVAYLARLTGSRERARELAQETFVRLYRAAPRYEERGQLSALIYRIATNLVRTEERRRRRWKTRSLDEPQVSELASPAHKSPQHGILERELQRVVAEAVAELPLHYRVPLVLHEIEGWTVPRIAACLAVREGTIKSRISRARSRLRRRLSPFWKGGAG